MSIFQNIYNSLPLVLQDGAITFKNIIVYYQKYKAIPFFRTIRSIQQDIVKNPRKYNDDKELSRFNKLLVYAKTNSSFYAGNKNYRKLKSLDDIASIPILEKKILRADSQKFISKEATVFNSKSFRTSGSTGTPLEGKIKTKDLQKRFDMVLSSFCDMGIDLSHGYARFPGAHISNTRDRLYRKDLLNNHYIFSIHHISQDNALRYYESIKNNGIKILEGYPSVIYALANLFSVNNYKDLNLDFFISTAEKLHPHQEEKIRDVFNCQVFDYYGSSEQSSYIFTCKEGKLHNSNVISTLEVLDERGQKVGNGEEGRMIVTSYTSSFTPLIRYNIGDRCKVAKVQSCSCGTGGVIIEEIIGRDEDVFINTDGKHVTRFSLVLKYLPDAVLESQIVLSNKKLNAQIYYTSNEDIERDKFMDFQKRLKATIGEQYDCTFEKVDKLIKQARGKSRAVIIEK